MPNALVAASATALPAVSRRRVVSGLAAISFAMSSATVTATVANAETTDPMLELVREYRRQWLIYIDTEAFEAWSSTTRSAPNWPAVEAEDRRVAWATYRPLHERLARGDDLPPLTTQAGAAECLAYVLEEMADLEPNDVDDSILAAVLGFLQRGAA